MLPYLAPNIRREKHQNQSWQTNGKRDCRGGESQRDVNPAASEREVNHGLDVAESILAVSNLNRPTKLSLRDVETGPQEHDGVEQKCCDQKCAVSISWRRMATNAKLTDDEERAKDDRIGTRGWPRSSSFGAG